ncbi:MAG: aldolase [Candidatus Nanopelagicales bacterium]|nr:aldolase [Candidatus Nanopelagicales bacterium]
MTEILIRGREEYGVVSVKAEFEAEGTRMDELLRLIDVASAAQLPVALKIGGCEAVRDLLEAKQLGVATIVAPMVETAYAASKYVAAKNLVFEQDEQEGMKFLFNIETITGLNNLDTMRETLADPEGTDGVVFGRVDFVGSMGWSREKINTQDVTDYVLKVAAMCRELDKDLVVGGGVSPDSLDALAQIAAIKLSRFETRKVIFSAGDALAADRIAEGLREMVKFELLWLQNKQDHYARVAREDAKRIEMLTGRKQAINV